MKKYFTFLLIITITTACSSLANEIAKHNFHNFLIEFRPQAETAGISSATLNEFMKNAQYLPKVIELDKKQPDKTVTFAQYLNSATPKTRIKMAREKYQEHKPLLDKIGKEYGVQPRFIVALWAAESDFGRNMGNFNVLNSLATLAFEGRRADFFKDELIKALKIIDSENIKPEALKGSWAGAMGQSQFMPTSFLDFAVDYNKDGTKDIWHSKEDVFASIANYLKQALWDKNSNWGREIQLPTNFNNALIGKNIEKTIKDWRALGVTTINGHKLPGKNGMKASIIKVEDTKNSRIFLIYNNYKILLKWNRSLYFASSIGLMADVIAPRPPKL